MKKELIIDLAKTVREGFVVVREPDTLLDDGVAMVSLKGGGWGFTTFDRRGINCAPTFSEKVFAKAEKLGEGG